MLFTANHFSARRLRNRKHSLYSIKRPETISLQPCEKRTGPQAAFLACREMPSFLWMISMHTMQNLETLFDKCPRCRLKKCQASSGWSAGEAVGSAETILTSAPPAQSKKLVSALPTRLPADQPHDAGHFFRRHRGCLSNRVSRYGGSKQACA